MADWIIGVIEGYGYWGLVGLMVLENIFPPIPSELIMPFAGFAAAHGELSLIGVLLAGTTGSLLGTLPWYTAGRMVTSARLKEWANGNGRWLSVSSDDVDRAEQWFQRRGTRAVLFGRMVPTVRTLISVPAGLVAMPLPRFLFWSALGSLVWVGVLTAIGYLLQEQYDRVHDWLNPVATAVVVVIVGVYLYRVATFERR
ncbi:MAG: DedA family protein [Proteobacteria bacterium]|nr:DedA family protein [Pseudomonadota bacterium]